MPADDVRGLLRGLRFALLFMLPVWLLVVLVLAACQRSGSAPAPARLAGHWAGSWTSASVPGAGDVELLLEQDGATLTGSVWWSPEPLAGWLPVSDGFVRGGDHVFLEVAGGRLELSFSFRGSLTLEGLYVWRDALGVVHDSGVARAFRRGS